MKKPYIIAIDGLDCSGKSTYAKKLAKYLAATFTNRKVVLQHFPVYESVSGKAIKKFLYTKADIGNETSKNDMVRLQITNRFDWFCDIQAMGDEMPDIVVADRYMESNCIYNGIGSSNMRAALLNIRYMESSYPQPRPDIQAFTFCDPRLQWKRIKDKQNKDKYENDIAVDALIKAYPKYLYYYRCDVDSTPVMIATHLMDPSFVHNDAPACTNGESEIISDEICEAYHNIIIRRIIRDMPQLESYYKIDKKVEENVNNVVLMTGAEYSKIRKV